MKKKKKIGRYLYYGIHNVKEGMINPVFWVAVILNAFVIYSTQETDTGSRIDMLEGVQTAFIVGKASYYVPVCVSLPGVMAFFDEKSNGAYRYKLLRTRRLVYVFRQVSRSMISGAGVMLFSFIMYSMVMLLLSMGNGVPVIFSGIQDYYGENVNIYVRLMADGRGWLVYLMHGSWLMFYAMVWPAFGVAVSAFVKNRKFSLASPFLLKRLLVYMIADEAVVLNFENLRLTGGVENLPLAGYPYALIYCLCLLFFCVVIVYMGLRIFLRKNG